MNDLINEQIWNLYILQEDIITYKNQAKNIVKNNNVDNYESLVDEFEKIITSVKDDKEESLKRLIKDDHLISLAFLYLGGYTNIDNLKNEYNMYIDAPSMSTTNKLTSFYSEIIKEIKDKKLF